MCVCVCVCAVRTEQCVWPVVCDACEILFVRIACTLCGMSRPGRHGVSVYILQGTQRFARQVLEMLSPFCEC